MYLLHKHFISWLWRLSHPNMNQRGGGGLVSSLTNEPNPPPPWSRVITRRAALIESQNGNNGKERITTCYHDYQVSNLHKSYNFLSIFFFQRYFFLCCNRFLEEYKVKTILFFDVCDKTASSNTHVHTCTLHT